ncbi:stage II sporulation protein R [Neobacillus sp. D3-1R]|uniref:stage II sporulation protein R n=1 Tax=Neobacillus sp. D3-1R TaxID=3445778 RepID=UPI003F9F6DCD
MVAEMTKTFKLKTLALSYILILSIGTILSLYIPKNEVTASEAVVIPKEAIRLRILANSDLESDQALKRMVRDEVNKNITQWVQELTSINDARTTLQTKLPEIQKIAEEVVKREGSQQTVNVEFGKVQFPTKLYGQFLYPAGEYEAILITLGEGKGANWWCVLFPPLCFLDFSNGVAVSDGFEDEKKVLAAEKTKEEQKVEEQPQEIVEKPKETQTEEVKTEKLEKKEIKTEQPSEPKQVESEKEEPVFVADAEEKVEVKFFLKELWMRLF